MIVNKMLNIKVFVYERVCYYKEDYSFLNLVCVFLCGFHISFPIIIIIIITFDYCHSARASTPKLPIAPRAAYVCVYIYIYIHVYIYIYIHSIHIYIYIYICMY